MGFLKRYRELILVAALLIVPLAIFFARARHPSERPQLDRVILAVTAPVEKGVAWSIGGVIDVWKGYVALRHSHQRANALQREVETLQLEHLELQRLRGENERLSKLLSFAEEVPDRRVLGARVVGVRLDPKGLQLLTIDRGARDGVARMMPVVVGHGVVGRIHAVTDGSADVLLLSDRNSSVAVRVERSRARANVRGTGSSDACRLEYALRSDDMVEGDLLVTSGTDGVFPRGLPVGKLSGVQRGGQGLYQRSDVTPAVDVTRLEEVLVLLSPGKSLEERSAGRPSLPESALRGTGAVTAQPSREPAAPPTESIGATP